MNQPTNSYHLHSKWIFTVEGCFSITWLFVCLFKLIPIAFSLCMRWWWLLQSPVCILCVHFKLLSKSLQNSAGFQCLWWQNSFTFCVFAWIILLKHIQVNLFVLSWREMEKECQAFPLPFQSVFLMNIPLLSYEQIISSPLGASKCLVSNNPACFLCSSSATEVFVSCIYCFLPLCSLSAFTHFRIIY